MIVFSYQLISSYLRPVLPNLSYKTVRLLILLLLLPVASLWAQTTTWSGSVSSDWFTAANWDNGVPGPGTDVVIGFIAASNSQPVLSSSTTIGSLTMGSNNQTLTMGPGITLTVAGNLSTGNSATITGTDVTLNVGGSMGVGNDVSFTTVTNRGTLTVGGNLTLADSKVFTSDFESITVGGNMSIQGTFNQESQGTLLQVGGDLFVNTNRTLNADFETITVDGEFGLNGTANLFSAEMQVSQLNVNNAGQLNIQNASLTLTNTPSTNTGNINVGDGVFTILGDFRHEGSGIITVQTGTINVGLPGPPLVAGNFDHRGSAQLILNQGSFNVYGASSYLGSATLNAGEGNILFQGDVQFGGGASFNSGTSTVTLSGDVTLSTTGNWNSNTITFFNLNVADGSNVTADANVVVQNNMIVDPTSTYDQLGTTTLNVFGQVIGEPEIDVNRPYVVAIEVVNNVTLRLFFNTEFQGNPRTLIPGTGTNGAERLVNYEVVDTGSEPISATLINPNTVELVFDPNIFTIQDNTQYLLWVRNLRFQENNTNNGQISANHFKLFGGPNFTVPQPMQFDYYPGGLDNTHLRLWLDVADQQTLFSNPSGTVQAVNGDRVARINDKSPSGRHAIQSTTNRRPLLNLTTAFEGQPSLRFNNFEFLPFDGSFLVGTSYTLGFFVDRTATSGRNIYLGGSGSGSNRNLHLFWGTTNQLEFHHFDNNFGAAVPAFTGSLEGEVHTFTLNTSLTSNARSIWRNGAFLGSGGTNASLISWDGASLGAYRDNEFFSGHIGEVYMFSRNLNETERLILDNYTAAKWGATLASVARYHATPTGFGQQLVGIGRVSAGDFVAQTAFTSGGLGLSSTTSAFLANNGNFLMVAHNGETGRNAETIFTITALYERPNRVWYADLTAVVPGGDITLSFDLDILNVTPSTSTGQFALLYNASDPDFSIFEENEILSTNASVAGNVVSFTLDANDISDGFVTLGFFITPSSSDPDQTLITAQPTVIEADGASTSLITVEARFPNGLPRSTGGDTVTLSATAGTLGAVNDNGDGTYTAVLTSTNTTGTATISGTINGDAISSQATVTFSAGAPAPDETLITASDTQLVANGTDQTTVTVQLRDLFGTNLTVGGASVVLSTTLGTLSSITDNNDGSYTATLTAATTIGAAVVSASVNGSPVPATATVDFLPGAIDLNASVLEAVPSQITANGTSQSVIVLELRDSNGNLVGAGGETVVFSTTSGTLAGTSDLGNGIYNTQLTSSTSVAVATITATVNGSPVAASTQVEFVDFDILRYYPGGLSNTHLQVWFDVADDAFAFSDVAGNVPAGFGDRVALLRDKSPNGRHAVQADPARQPERSATGAFGDRPSLIFNNSEFLPFDGTFLAGTSYTVTFLLDRSFGGSGRNIFFGGTSESSNTNLHMFWNGSTTLEHHHWGNNYSMTVPAYTGNLTGEIHTYNLNTAIQTPSRRTWRNGTLIGSGGTNATLSTMEGAGLGRFRNTDFFRGRMGEIIMHNRALNTTEFIILQNYLSARWGVGIDGNITYYQSPDADFFHQLVGIGRVNPSDMVTRTEFSSGGLALNSDGFSFLSASQRYLMAAHNNLTGLAATQVTSGESTYERWNRAWYVEKSVVTAGGNLAIEFDFFDYGLPVPPQNETFELLFHPTDPTFPAAGVQLIPATVSFLTVNRLRFVVEADNLSNGFYTLGRRTGTVTYFSRTSGNFNEASSWSTTGHDGAPHVTPPGPTSTVVIGGAGNTDHTITLTANYVTQTGATLTITDTGEGAGILLTGSHLITGGGSVTVSSGGTLGIGSPDGISATASSGSIRTATRSFSDDALYLYNGTAAQITGSGLPASVRILTVDNTNGVSLTNNLTVTGETILQNGNLTVPSGRALVSASYQYNGGLLRALRELWVPSAGTPGGWRLLSSPIATDYANLFSELLTQGFPGSDLGVSSTLIPNVLWYEESFEGTDNQRWRAPLQASDALVPGRGLFTYVFGDIPTDSRYNQSAVTLEVIGEEHAGDISLPVTFTPEGDQGWNLVGNPYLSTIFWNDPDGWVKEQIGASIYVWDQQANGGNGAFLEWNGVTGWGNGFIKPFQGFWVQATGSQDLELTVRSQARSATVAGTFYRRPIHPEIEFQIVSADSLKGRAIVLFTEEGRTGKDPLDTYRLQSLSDTYIDLFSVSADGERLAINNLPLRFARTIEIPLEMDGATRGMPFNGDVTFSLKRFSNLPDDWEITLIDRQTGQRFNRDQMMAGIHVPLRTDGRRAKAMVTEEAAFHLELPDGPGTVLRDAPVLMRSNPSRSRFVLQVTPLNPPADVPAQFALSQNYPNPFNPSTTVPFQLAADGNVRIEVFDITGRRVAVLLDEFRQAGFYEVSWNASAMASGVYIYRMMTVEGILTGKMTLIK